MDITSYQEAKSAYFVSTKKNSQCWNSSSLNKAYRPYLLVLIKRIYSLEGLLPEAKYADVFKGLGETKGVQHMIKLDPNATPVMYPPRRVPVALCERLRRNFSEWRIWLLLKN